MSSRTYFVIHSFLLVILTLFCVSSPFFAILYPGFFSSSAYLPSIIILEICLLLSWLTFGGSCPLTIWEKEALEREKKEVYSDKTFFKYWFRSMLGLKLEESWVSVILLILYVIPVTVGLYLRYA